MRFMSKTKSGIWPGMTSTSALQSSSMVMKSHLISKAKRKVRMSRPILMEALPAPMMGRIKTWPDILYKPRISIDGILKSHSICLFFKSVLKQTHRFVLSMSLIITT